MVSSVVYDVAALATLVPPAALRLRERDRRDGLFWAGLVLAVVAPTAWAIAQLDGTWRTGFAMSLWLTIAVTLALFALLALATRQAWRLTPLLMPYLAILGVIAIIWQHAPEHSFIDNIPAGWMSAHIVFALATYGLITLAAVAGMAVFVQERALKARQPTTLTRLLPAVGEGERLLTLLLGAGEAVLALGLASGMAAEHFASGRLLLLDHKTTLSLAAFIAIGGLLLAQRYAGVRGRRAARGVLVAYLLLTLAYPGVKFVTEVLMS